MDVEARSRCAHHACVMLMPAVVGEKTAEPAGRPAPANCQLMLQIKKHATLRFAQNVRPNTGVSIYFQL